VDRNSSDKRVFLSDSELAKRSAPGGRTPVATAKSTVTGDPGWTGIGDATPATAAGSAERQFRRERPDIVAARAAKGK
jgi:hypothetical protein